MGMTFFQLLITMPLYYEEQFGLNEFKIGLIMFINVAIIVLFEMPFINFLEKKNIKSTQFIIVACILFGLSFYVLFNNFWIGILIVSMIIITFAEMLGFPYTNTFALQRAKDGYEGSYMALYAMSFSLAHIFSSKIGLSIVDNYGYQINWLITGSFSAIAMLLAIWLHKRIKNNLQ